MRYRMHEGELPQQNDSVGVKADTLAQNDTLRGVNGKLPNADTYAALCISLSRHAGQDKLFRMQRIGPEVSGRTWVSMEPLEEESGIPSGWAG